MDHKDFEVSIFNTVEIAARYRHAGFCQGIKSIIQIANDLGSERAIEEARKFYNAHKGEDEEPTIVIDATDTEEDEKQ